MDDYLLLKDNPDKELEVITVLHHVFRIENSPRKG